MNILHRLWRKKQYYTAFLGGHAAMPLISGIIKRSNRFIRNKYNRKNFGQRTSILRPKFFCFLLPKELKECFPTVFLRDPESAQLSQGLGQTLYNGIDPRLCGKGHIHTHLSQSYLADLGA